MVRELFGAEPDEWQMDALRAFPSSPRLALRACAGPGKTSVLAWLGWNFMLTRPHPMVGATSITGDNLKANLWAELARWRSRAPLLESAFEMSSTAIYSRESPATWRMEARSWARDADSTQIGNALRGLHAEYIMWLLDETGDYPDSILPVCENIFSGDPKEAHIVQAGNPSRLGGPLYRACTVAKHLWHVITITGDPDDPKRSPRIGLEHARAQIEQYGRDNPWVMINILGLFPPGNLNALIGLDELEAATKRFYREDELRGAPKIIAADVARQGAAQSVIARRWGLQMLPFKKYRNIDSLQGAGAFGKEWDDFGADAAFIDATGGFGASWIDQLRTFGRTAIGIQFAGKALQEARYFNKRTEMAFDWVELVRRGLAIPDDDRLIAAASQTTYFFKGDKMLLEPKEDVEKKLGYSPDEFDASILTVAQSVKPKGLPLPTRRQSSAVSPDYNPFSAMMRDDQYRP